MNIANIIEIVRGSVAEEDLVPVHRLKDPSFFKEIQETLTIPTYEEISQLASTLGEPPERFYVNQKGFFSPLVYFYNGVFMDIVSLADDYIQDFQIKDIIQANRVRFDTALQQNQYQSLFIQMDSRIRILMFKRWFNEIPDTDIYDIFLMVYTHADYGFTQIDQKFFSRILQCKPEEQQQNIDQQLRKKADKQGFVSVYRGAGSKSTPPEKAYSWTINLNTALFFATRFSETGTLYAGKVPIQDVVAYIEDRNEEEVLVLPGKVKHIRPLEMLTVETVFTDIPDLDVDFKWEERNIDPHYFERPDSIHGVLHAKRVLLLTLIIAHYEGLSENDRKIVLTAAKHHDIGRKHDDYDEVHGRWSVEKMQALNLVDPSWKEEDIQILQYIIENHCIPDKQGRNNLAHYPIRNKKRALFLYHVIKDADGLDRVRLGDTDIQYIRLPISKRLPLVAQQLYKRLK